MIPIDQIQHVQQPCATTCGHACLAMMLGVPVESVIEVAESLGFPRELGMTERKMAKVCMLFDVHFTHRFVPSGHALLADRFIVSVPSHNRPGGMHYIACTLKEGNVTILDPNRGREGQVVIERWEDLHFDIVGLFDDFSDLVAAA